jgi:hypothetical protein
MSFADLTKTMHGAVFGSIGEPVVVNGTAVTGIFKADYEALDVSSGVPVSTVQPVLEVREYELLDGVEEGDAVVVQGKTYVVADVRPDGHGVLKLFLHKSGGIYDG